MKLRAIKLSGGDSELAAMPTKITVEMTVEEAVWIAKVAGQQRGTSPHSEIYSCLTGDFFNRFWDDGVNDAERDFPVTIPPIRYED